MTIEKGKWKWIWLHGRQLQGAKSLLLRWQIERINNEKGPQTLFVFGSGEKKMAYHYIHIPRIWLHKIFFSVFLDY